MAQTVTDPAECQYIIFYFSGRIISYWKDYKQFPDLKRPSTVNMENRMTSQ